MNENLHDIDKLFKNAIDQHEEEPSSGVWENVDKNLDKKKVVLISKKYQKLKWVAAVLLLFSFGLAMFTLQTKTRNNELIKQYKHINPSSKNAAPIQKNGVPDTLEKISALNNSTRFSIQKSTKKIIGDNHELNQNKNETDLDQQSPGNQVNISSGDKKGIRNVQLPVSSKNSLQTTASGNTIVKHPVLEKYPAPGSVKKERPDDIQVNKDKDEVAKNNEKYLAAIPFSTYQQQPSRTESIIPPVFNPANITAGESQNPVKNIHPMKNTLENKNPKRNPSLGLFAATIFYAPDIVSANVRNDHPGYREEDRDEVRKNESTRTASTYGILIDRVLNNKLAIQTGLTIFNRITDIHSKTIYARADDRGTVQYRFNCSSGYSYIPAKSGNSPVAGDSTKAIAAKSTLQYISVPLVIKYNIKTGKLNLSPGAGVSLNFLSRGKIETLIENVTGNESATTNNIQGLKSNYLNGLLSMDAEYMLTKKLALTFIPTGRFALSPINKSGPVKTTLNSIGMSAGIRLKL